MSRTLKQKVHPLIIQRKMMSSLLAPNRTIRYITSVHLGPLVFVNRAFPFSRYRLLPLLHSFSIQISLPLQLPSKLLFLASIPHECDHHAYEPLSSRCITTFGSKVSRQGKNLLWGSQDLTQWVSYIAVA